MKKFALILSLFAVLCAPAHAQQPAAVDPATTAAVKRLLASMNYKATMTATLGQMVKTLPANIRGSMEAAIAGNATLTDAQRQKARQDADKMIPQMTASVNSLLTDPTLLDELMTAMVPVYARNFSVQELDQMASFYASPIGKKMLTTMPQLVGESMAVSQRIIAPRVQKLVSESTKPILQK